jgi:hypothetical protein
MRLEPNGNLAIDGTLSQGSDRNRKENPQPIDPAWVLEKIAALPIETWTYRDDEAKARHLGPMAQDFHAAFGLGTDDKSIATVDADGVALAAIQGLNQKLEAQGRAKDAEIRELRQSMAELKKLVDSLLHDDGGAR